MAKKFMYEHDAPIVETDCGRVHGFMFDDVYTFKGIPYARAKRFKDPQRFTWDGVLECTNFNYACPVIEAPALDHSIDFDRHLEVKSEECQNLNIWTPGLDGAKRPVVVWLHGGGMSFGSSSEDGLCTGENIAKCGDAVCVSVNHRLNILGYCDLSDFGDEYKNSANQGIADMVFALKWVHENIEKFGGDPGNVTLFGQSGGGMKVTTILQTPAADGLFHKGVIMSGVQSESMCDNHGSGKAMGEYLMKETGCKDISELSEVSLDKLFAAAAKMRKEMKFKGFNTGETPTKNYYYMGDPSYAGFREETKNIPLFVGTTFGEFNATKSYAYEKHKMSDDEMRARVEAEFGKELADKIIPIFKEAYPARPLIDVISADYLFRYYAKAYVKKRSALNSCTYEYVFDQDMPMLGGVSPLHGNDLGFFFHTTEKAPGLNEPGVTEAVEDQVFKTFMAFARTGDPNNETIPELLPSAPGKVNTIFFRKEPEVRVNFDDSLNAALSDAFLDEQEEFMRNAISGRLG